MISPKGGVGKTTSAFVVGSLLADRLRLRVIAVDANPDFGTLAALAPTGCAASGRSRICSPTSSRSTPPPSCAATCPRCRAGCTCSARPADADGDGQARPRRLRRAARAAGHLLRARAARPRHRRRGPLAQFAIARADQVVLVTTPEWVTSSAGAGRARAPRARAHHRGVQQVPRPRPRRPARARAPAARAAPAPHASPSPTTTSWPRCSTPPPTSSTRSSAPAGWRSSGSASPWPSSSSDAGAARTPRLVAAEAHHRHRRADRDRTCRRGDRQRRVRRPPPTCSPRLERSEQLRARPDQRAANAWPPRSRGCAPNCGTATRRARTRTRANQRLRRRTASRARAGAREPQNELPSAADGDNQRAMGFFFKALAAIVTADAIDRHARSRPTATGTPTSPASRRPTATYPATPSLTPRPHGCGGTGIHSIPKDPDASGRAGDGRTRMPSVRPNRISGRWAETQDRGLGSPRRLHP